MTTDPKTLAERIERDRGWVTEDGDQRIFNLTDAERDTILSALRARAPGEEEIKTAIRAALVEDWSCYETASKWREDVLLTGCQKVGNGQGYEKPADAANKLAADAARAVLFLLSQPQGEGQGGAAGETAIEFMAHTARQIEELLEDRILELEAERDAVFAAGFLSCQTEAVAIAKAEREGRKGAAGSYAKGACSTAHNIENAIAALTPPADAWRPIETAPKEGTRVIIMCDQVYVASYDAGNDLWYFDVDGAAVDPSHWQPLPHPPLDRSGQ